MQLRLDEDNPIEQLLHHCVLVLVKLLRYRGQFSVSLLVYGGLDALSVSCVRCLICLDLSLFLGFVRLNLLGRLQIGIFKPLCAILTSLLNNLLGLLLGLEKGLNALRLAGLV